MICFAAFSARSPVSKTLSPTQERGHCVLWRPCNLQRIILDRHPWKEAKHFDALAGRNEEQWLVGRSGKSDAHARFEQVVKSEKLENESSPKFFELSSQIFSRIFLRIFAEFFEDFRLLFPRQRETTKNHRISPPFFNAKSPGKYEKIVHKILLERTGRDSMTQWEERLHVSNVVALLAPERFLSRMNLGLSARVPEEALAGRRVIGGWDAWPKFNPDLELRKGCVTSRGAHVHVPT